ncbi:MAG: hypothetical protein AAGF99_10195 [Bacteroidota bacterium]
MARVLLLMLLVLSTALSGCDSSSESDALSIEGSWEGVRDYLVIAGSSMTYLDDDGSCWLVYDATLTRAGDDVWNGDFEDDDEGFTLTLESNKLVYAYEDDDPNSFVASVLSAGDLFDIKPRC